MKTYLTISLLCVLTPVLSTAQVHAQAQESARTVFEQARLLDERNQNLTDAIALYERVASGESREPRLAAEAQYRAGLLHERLGNAEKAQMAFRAVVERFPREEEMIRRARAKLAVPEFPELRLRQIWAGEDVDVLGSPSPDGRYLSYVDWSTGDLAVRDLSTGENRRLTSKGSWEASPHEFALFSVFSRDGSRLAYTWFTKNNRVELRTVNIDGSGTRTRYDGARYVQAYDWSPDGESILVLIQHEDGPGEIAMLSKDTSRTIKILGEYAPTEMGFSPDGRYVAFDYPAAENAPERDIYVLNVQTGDEHALIRHAADDFLLAWTPDGSSILYASDRTGTVSAWMVPVSGGAAAGKEAWVRPGLGERVMPIGMTRDGTFYFSLGISDADNFTIDWDPVSRGFTSEWAPVAPRYQGGKQWAAWSPDGARIAYLFRRSGILTPGATTIIIRSTEDDRETSLKTPFADVRTARWSPDGKRLLIWGQQKGAWTVAEMDIETGDTRSILPAGIAGRTWSPRWTRDGKHLLYIRRSEDWTRNGVARWSIDRQEEELLVDEYGGLAGIAIAESPDGRTLAYSIVEADSSSLYVKPMDGGDARELLRVPHPERIFWTVLEWTPDGKEIVFARGPNPDIMKAALWRISVDGGDPIPLEPALNVEHIRHFQFHPDGNSALFTAGRQRAEIWTLENFLDGR